MSSHKKAYKVLHGFFHEQKFYGGNTSSDDIAALPSAVLKHQVANKRVKEYNILTDEGRRERAANPGGRTKSASRGRAKAKKDAGAADTGAGQE